MAKKWKVFFIGSENSQKVEIKKVEVFIAYLWGILLCSEKGKKSERIGRAYLFLLWKKEKILLTFYGKYVMLFMLHNFNKS